MLSATLTAEPKSEVLTLQPFIVEAARIGPLDQLVLQASRSNGWRYIAVPGYEILSDCGRDQTDAVARHVANSLELERRLLPAGSWGDLPVPLTYIMFDFKPAYSAGAFVPKPLAAADPEEDYGGAPVKVGDERVGGADTGDADTHCVVQNRWNVTWNWSGGALGRGPIPLGRLFHLNSASPPLPSWFQYGLVGPCGVFRMRAVRDPRTWEYRGAIFMAVAQWRTEAGTEALVKRYKKTGEFPVLPAVGDLFKTDHRTRTSVIDMWPNDDYMAEAALFVRWGMAPVSDKPRLNQAHRLAFERFLERSRAEPVTENLFRECFGFGYARLQAILSEYLVTKAQEPVALGSRVLTRFSPDAAVEGMREPTSAEIGRIIGDWLRMQAAALPPSRRAERAAYLRGAGRVLERAFREENELSKKVRLLPPKDAEAAAGENASPSAASGEGPVAVMPSKFNDPRFLAAYALYYFDVGDAESARILLEAVVQKKAPRPAAYLALAQLNRDAALAKPAADNGEFSRDQVASILAPLFVVIRNWQLDVPGYLLIAEAWSRSAAKPSLESLQIMVDGLHRYPFDSSLLRATAELYARWGYWTEADATVERSFGYADAATGEKLRSEQATWTVKRTAK